MNYSAYYSKIIQRFYIAKDASNLKASFQALEKLPQLPVYEVRSQEDIPQKHLNAQTLYITVPKGAVAGHCPGSKGHVCCNYITMDLYMGCTLGCSYCIMKGYLNFSPITVYADPAKGIDDVINLAKQNPEKILRVGTGEVGDSLQFDPLFELSKEFIDAFSHYSNIQLELKTKTNFVDHLLKIPDKGQSIIAFSLNPDDIQCSEEPLTASIPQRMDAAEKALHAGYKLAFHFDPIIPVKDWKKKYAEIVFQLQRFPLDSIVWISLGTFRYTPRLKENMAERPFLYDEFVPCADGKFRYIQKERSAVYLYMRELLKQISNAPVYLCMESEAVWENVYNAFPENIEKLKALFTEADGVDFHPSSRRGI